MSKCLIIIIIAPWSNLFSTTEGEQVVGEHGTKGEGEILLDLDYANDLNILDMLLKQIYFGNFDVQGTRIGTFLGYIPSCEVLLLHLCVTK
jgi:hypothetical protein